jgi:hypothetical protein
VANVGVASASNSLRCRRLCRGLLAVTPVETIHTAGGVNQLLLAGKKGMAGGTDFHVQVAFTRRTSLESLAAGTGHGYFAIFRMNSGFHFLLTFIGFDLVAAVKHAMIRVAVALRQANRPRRKDNSLLPERWPIHDYKCPRESELTTV